MDSPAPRTLPKQERLCSRKAIDELFGGGHQSVTAYPIRAIFMPREGEGVRIMVSVSKRHFKRAVRRNRIKRQLREAYRLHRELLGPQEGGMDIAFLWTSQEVLPTEKVFQRMRLILTRIGESIVSQ